MKTTIKILGLAFVLFATACNNDDEIDMFNSLWRNVTQNEARINDLEEWCAQANTNISSLQTLVKAIEEKKTISNILPIVLNGDTIGYTMNFGDKGPITIYDDSNPVNAPKISVKSENDVYYWTLNGEWLLDENGNKLRVSGADGQDGTNGQNGITPQLKIENDYWYISYDNGNTWTELGKAKGEDGQDGVDGANGQAGEKGEKGDTGDSMFQSVTQDENYVYFTLADGTVITIAKKLAKKPYLAAKSNSSDYGTVTGSGYYDVGAEVTITATPKENYYFTGWSDCDSKELTRIVQVNSDTTIIANFAKKPYLTAKPNNSNYGTVTGSGYYEVGSVVTITATPKSGYIFVQWSDGNTENPRTVIVTSDVTYTAIFKVNAPDGAFSVGSGKYVYFSSGNLQYHPANDEWRFAPSQLDYIGDANINCSSTYNGWLDLFGWSGSTGSEKFGVSTSKGYNAYSGDFVDWGSNQIGDDVPNTWRTLTCDEWYYLCRERPNYSNLCGVAQVNGVNGLILLPDGWFCPDGVTFRSGFHDSYGVDYYAAYQTFTAAEWSKMEQAGAVFLPAAGRRYGSEVDLVQSNGRYWSATEDGSNHADYLFFNSGGGALMYYGSDRYNGLSVRLVKDL